MVETLQDFMDTFEYDTNEALREAERDPVRRRKTKYDVYDEDEEYEDTE